MLLSIGTLIVVAYLILSINVYLESYAFGRFSIGYGLVGPTEIRLILIALNTVVALGAGLDFVIADLELTVFDVIGLAIAATMIALLLGRAAGTCASWRARSRQRPAADAFSRTLRPRALRAPCFSGARARVVPAIRERGNHRESQAEGPLKGDSQSFVARRLRARQAENPPDRIFFL